MEFKVKRDFLLIFIINLVLAFILSLALYFSYNTAVLVTFLVLSVGGIALFNTSVIFASCKLTNEELVFKTGIFKYTIKINTIAKITPTKNAYGSLALSFDRLRILTFVDGKQKVYYISVKDNEKLLSVLIPTKKEEKVEAVKTEEVEAPAKKTVAKKATTTTKKTTAKSTSTKKTTTKKTTTKATKETK